MPRAEVDAQALHAAVDQQRGQLGLSWRELSRELGISPSTFSRMIQGHRPDADTFATLLRWLGMPAAAFTRPTLGDDSPDAEPLAVISSYLRAAKHVTPEAAAALEDIIAAAYRRLVRDPP